MFGAALRQNSRVCSRALRLSRGYGRIASGIPSELDSTAREADATAFDARAGLVWWRPGSLADLGALGTPGSSRQLFGFSTQSAAEGEGKEKGEEETETSTAADQGAEENEAEAEEEAEAEGVSRGGPRRPGCQVRGAGGHRGEDGRRERRLQGQAH